jgi:hypothetical protein
VKFLLASVQTPEPEVLEVVPACAATPLLPCELVIGVPPLIVTEVKAPVDGVVDPIGVESTVEFTSLTLMVFVAAQSVPEHRTMMARMRPAILFFMCG